MPFTYKKGQVVDVAFPNDDPANPGLKTRPCVILDDFSDSFFKFICITGTDRRKTNKGFWIDRNSKNYNVMRLSKPSFINLDDIKTLPVQPYEVTVENVI